MSKRKPIIYIMHPYSSDPEGNYWHSLEVCNDIVEMGGIPVNPLFFHQVDKIQHRPYAEWMSICLELLKPCDAAYRQQGKSDGATEETINCFYFKKTVLLDMDKLKEYIERF